MGYQLGEQDQELSEQLADVYSIFVATEALEKFYIRDCIPHEEFVIRCKQRTF